MDRKTLSEHIGQYCDKTKDLFAYKNTDYGNPEDGFGNFRKTAERLIIPFLKARGVDIDIYDAMFLALLIYQDKHLVALSHTGLNGAEVDERLGDIANYALIGRAMLEAKSRTHDAEKKGAEKVEISGDLVLPSGDHKCANCALGFSGDVSKYPCNVCCPSPFRPQWRPCE